MFYCRIQLACDAQIPTCLNGPEGEVVYIDTEVHYSTRMHVVSYLWVQTLFGCLSYSHPSACKGVFRVFGLRGYSNVHQVCKVCYHFECLCAADIRLCVQFAYIMSLCVHFFFCSSLRHGQHGPIKRSRVRASPDVRFAERKHTDDESIRRAVELQEMPSSIRAHILCLLPNVYQIRRVLHLHKLNTSTSFLVLSVRGSACVSFLS